MLKMKVDPAMCMKTMESMTICRPEIQEFYRKNGFLASFFLSWRVFRHDFDYTKTISEIPFLSNRRRHIIEDLGISSVPCEEPIFHLYFSTINPSP